LEFVEKGFSHRIIVLDEAKQSAKEYEVRDLNKAYRLIKSIPEVLHSLIFNGDGDKRASYTSSTGFDLAMSESKMTKGDKNLAKLRLREYNGKEVDINAHVGFGNKHPNMLRIHFHISADDRKIVIGHCGDHLDTYSTRWMN